MESGLLSYVRARPERRYLGERPPVVTTLDGPRYHRQGRDAAASATRKLTQMDLIPFVVVFPEQGQAEIRSFTLRGALDLPDGDYALLEAYCPKLDCHCRRVMLNIIGRTLGP